MNRTIYPTILIVLAIGIYFTVTKGVLSEAKTIKSANNEYVTAIDNAKNLIALRDQVLADFNRLSMEDRLKLEKIVPKSVDGIRLIIDLNNIALGHSFSLRNVKVTAAPIVNAENNLNNVGAENGAVVLAEPILDTVAVTFDLNAPYQQFISFIQTLESSLRILDMTSLKVTVNEDGIYNWNVELKTYWLRKP